MENQFIFVDDLGANIALPENGILSRTIQTDDQTKVILFHFAPGQELSAHTAPYPATIYFVRGEATVKLGTETREVTAGAFAYMTPKLEHGIKAKTETVMLLTMVKAAKAD
jgi:quercetin dioxygenase-like cupin family protein